MFLRLGKAGRYYVTKAIFLFVSLFLNDSFLLLFFFFFFFFFFFIFKCLFFSVFFFFFFFFAPEQVLDEHLPQLCNMPEWIDRSGLLLFVSSGIHGKTLRKRRLKLRSY